MDKLQRTRYTVLEGAFGFSLTIMAVVAVSLALGIITFSSGSANTWYSVAAMGVIQLCFAFIWFKYSRSRGICPVKAVKLKKPTLLGAAFGLAVAFAMFAAGIGIEQLLILFFNRIGYTLSEIELSPAQIVLFAIITVTLAPVGEELIFRGIILRSLEKRKILAILLSGGLFAIFHMMPEQTVYQFLLGCALAFVALKTDSLLPAMLGHFVSNALALSKSLFFGGATFNIVFISIGAVCLIAAMLMLIFKVKLKKDSEAVDTDSSNADASAKDSSPTESAAQAATQPNAAQSTDTQAETNMQSAKTNPLLNPANHLVTLVYFLGIGVCLIIWISTLIQGL